MNLQINSQLQNGKYRIEKVLGQGGFGITYLAMQVGLNRKVAIKEFFMKEYCNRDEATSSVSLGTVGSREVVMRFREKFIKEAQNIAVLNHPHIIRIYDVFEENNTAYYVMEYLDNASLSDYLKQKGRLSEQEAVRFIKQIADALAYIHEHKINHLDVKPGNILLDNKNNAVLIDFGLAKHYNEAGHQTSTTPVGISHGYAPLEQYKQGGVGTFSPTTDIYSLAATLYKLVTGQTPPDAGDVNEDGLPPFPADISQPTINAITKAMQGSRKNRPQSIAEFIEILDGKGLRSQGHKDAEVQRADDEETILDVNSDNDSDTGSDTDYGKCAPITASAPKTPEAPKKKKSRAWIFILLAIIIGGAGYLSWRVFDISANYTALMVEGDNFLNTDQYEFARFRYEIALKLEEDHAILCDIGILSGESRDKLALVQEKEQEAEQLAAAQKEAEAKAVAEKKRKEEETKAQVEASYNKMIEDKEKYLSLISEGNRMLDNKNYSESIIKYELAQVYEEKYTGTEYSSHFNKGVNSKIGNANNLLKEYKAEQERLEKERRAREVAASAEREKYNGHEYVDLGLSVKWATCNVGANKPEDYGNYYAWGETSTKNKYTQNNSITYHKILGDIGGKLQYDAARDNWGGNWRLPTKAEFEELKNSCTWQWTTQNGVKGYKVTGPNGNSIFLPAAGARLSSLYSAGVYGDYWSSTPAGSTDAYVLDFYSNGQVVDRGDRPYGLSVRPVAE